MCNVLSARLRSTSSKGTIVIVVLILMVVRIAMVVTKELIMTVICKSWS